MADTSSIFFKDGYRVCVHIVNPWAPLPTTAPCQPVIADLTQPNPSEPT